MESIHELKAEFVYLCVCVCVCVCVCERAKKHFSNYCNHF